MSTYGFIGFGLIGGSIARALKALPDPPMIISYNHNSKKTNASLNEAVADGIIDIVSTNLEQDFADCDIIFLCAPILKNIEYLERLKTVIKKDCILTDVGSVKGNIQEAAEKLLLSSNFIGGHPMAGSEKTGYHSSHEKLLENAYYILTPFPKTPAEKLKTLTDVVTKVGAIPIILNAQEHDLITAAISHVPHLIAAELVNLVKNSDDASEKMRMLAAGGFKDITRIASSSPVIWQNICLTNADSIKTILSRYMNSLASLYEAIDRKDGKYLFDIFEEAGTYRSQIPNSNGLLNRIYEVFIDITDEAGAIAIIATLLGSNQISIKNIGIIHNREFEQGVLRIEFYKNDEKEKAVQLLKAHNYTIYER